MSVETVPHGVMEGRGAYNRHAKTQAAGAALATPFLEEAVRSIGLDPTDQPIVIADYGSSQGRNSLAPMRIAIQNLRQRVGLQRPIFTFHIDQPANDFNCLFEVLNSDPERYASAGTNVFPCAIGRSFYEQVLPPESVHLGWSSYAAMWLRRIPSLIPGHFWSPRSTGEVRAAFERQAEEDWELFLSLRACEMKRGARLVVVLPALPDGGPPGVADLMDHANAALAEMVDEGSITAAERDGMVLGSHPRRKSDLLAPFAKSGDFHGLVVKQCKEFLLPDVSWAEYQQNRDKQALATRRALFFRATFVPSLASALTPLRAGHPETLQSFADRLQNGIISRLSREPLPLDMLVEVMLFEKSYGA